jgi:hypothetical protein
MSDGPEKSPERASLYDKSNDSVRVDQFFEMDDAVSVGMRSFFRKLGAPHLYEERIIPTLKMPEGNIFAAVRDRPWPPWGHGSRLIAALVQVHSISGNSFGLSPMYVRPEEVANIGLRTALYKEMLENLGQRANAEVNYLVREGAILTDMILKSVGFQPSKDLLQTEDARYFFYRVDCRNLLDQLQLAKVSIPELLSHKASTSVFEKNALYQSVLDWARVREIIAIDGGSFDASLPGGVPPSPPSHQVEIGPFKDVIRSRN